MDDQVQQSPGRTANSISQAGQHLDKDEELEAMRREYRATRLQASNDQGHDEERLQWLANMEPLPKELERAMYTQVRDEKKRKEGENALREKMKGNVEWEQEEEEKRERDRREIQYLEAALQKDLEGERTRNQERIRDRRSQLDMSSDTEDDEQADGNVLMKEVIETQRASDEQQSTTKPWKREIPQEIPIEFAGRM